MFRLLATRTVQYVLARMRSNTRTSSCRTFCQLSRPTPTRHLARPHRPSASEPFLPRPSAAHVLSCHLASFVRIRPAQPQLQPAARARLLRPEIFFFFLSLRCARERRVRVFHHPERDHLARHGVSIKACAHARRFPRACCCFHRRVVSYVRTWPRATYVSPPRGKGRAKCVCRFYIYADQKWGHGACVSLSICSHTEITYIYSAVYSCVCVCVCMAVWDGRLFGMHFGFKRLAVGGSGQVYSWC